MNKPELESSLQNAFNNGFWPKEITRYSGASQLQVLNPEGEEDRIVVGYKTQEINGREHNHTFIYSLEEAEALLAEYRS